MEIINRLRIRGNENAFMLRDADVTYPVFSTSLLAAEIFSQLISSGYKLCGLPFDFRKDGMSIMQLPVIDYTPTLAEEQDMFDIDSAPKMSNEEARSKISAEDVKYVETPPCNYAYTTREEFISYLKTIQVSKMEDFPIPINYFVHPSALFTVEEWRSGEYSEYFTIMENRRRINHTQFVRLREWLSQYHPSVADSVGDFLEAYYAWGIDGLNVKFVNKKRKVSYISYNAATTSIDNYQLSYEDVGLVDRYGAVFPPEDIKPEGAGWKVAYQGGKEDPAFRRIIANLKEGEYGIAKVSFTSSEEVIELQSLRDTFTVTPYRIISGEQESSNFVITTFDASPTVVNCRWWASRYDHRVYEMSRLRAIAYSIVSQRKRSADVSSFKALLDVGLDVRGALMYIMNKIPKTTEEDVNGVVQEVYDPTMPTDKDIQDYVNGVIDRDSLDADALARVEMLDSIIKGEVNIDGVADGDRQDKSIDVRTVYRYFSALYFCRTHVSMDKLNALAKNTNAQVVTAKDNLGIESEVLTVYLPEGFYMNIPCPLLNAKIEGYNSDLVKYKVAMADDCSYFCKVVNVAREYGTNDATRHVAFEMQCVHLYNNGKRTVAYDNLERILSEFDEALGALPGWQQTYLKPYRKSSCMIEYFRVAEQGYMLLSAELGNKRIDFSPEFVASVRSTIVNEITSTSLYSYFLQFNGRFTHFCVNADITPFKVYPKPMANIPEISIHAAWEDIVQKGGAQIFQKLTADGFLYANYMPWTYRYYNQRHFKDLTELHPMFDLCQYKLTCDSYRMNTTESMEYIHAPHMETLIYGYYPSETDRVDLGGHQRDGQPPLYVSKAVMLNKSMFPEHGQVSEEKLVSEPALKPFRGFDAEDFEMLQNVEDVMLPDEGEENKYLFVGEDGISTESQDDLPYYAIEQLVGRGYPVIRLWGRKYVFRDMYGSLWEVRV